MIKVTGTAMPIYILEKNDSPEVVKQIAEEHATVIGSNGIFKVTKNCMVNSITQQKIVPEVKTSVDIALKAKIPSKLIDAVIGLFLGVYEKHKSECCIILYYNPEHTDANQAWAFAVPKQKVSAAAVNYNLDDGVEYYVFPYTASSATIHNDFIQAGSIHSHASMAAFHSGTDDGDEFNFDGIHVTIGKMQDENQEFACRIMTYGYAHKVTLKEIVELDKKHPWETAMVEAAVVQTNPTEWGTPYAYRGQSLGKQFAMERYQGKAKSKKAKSKSSTNSLMDKGGGIREWNQWPDEFGHGFSAGVVHGD